MFRLLALLALLPSLAAADWSPRPSSFDYAATFEACTFDPALRDLAAHCGSSITAAYILKRAVTRATLACRDTPLSNCAPPFEAEGLPAVAMKIAIEAGCDNHDPASLPEGLPLHDNHCISLSSDIMIDEGVVPLDTIITCDQTGDECIGLIRLQSWIWRRAIADLSSSDLTIIRARTVLDDCLRDSPDTLAMYDCRVECFAEIWVDLTLQTEKEN